jgi:hypothetical protein
MPRDNEEWYSRRPSKLVKEKPIHPVPAATGAATATGASVSNEGPTEDVRPPRDPSVKHHLLDDYDAWNKRWLEDPRNCSLEDNCESSRTLKPSVLDS